VKGKGEGAVVPLLAVKVHMTSEGRAPLIFNLETSWMWVVSLTCRSLYPWGKTPCYPLNTKMNDLEKR